MLRRPPRTEQHNSAHLAPPSDSTSCFVLSNKKLNRLDFQGLESQHSLSNPHVLPPHRPGQRDGVHEDGVRREHRALLRCPDLHRRQQWRRRHHQGEHRAHTARPRFAAVSLPSLALACTLHPPLLRDAAPAPASAPFSYHCLTRCRLNCHSNARRPSTALQCRSTPRWGISIFSLAMKR